MPTISIFVNSMLGLGATLLFGFWLGKVGKPYNGILFNVHKLIALGTVILTGIQVYKIGRFIEFPILIMLIATVACIVGLFASGAVLSIQSTNNSTTNSSTVKTIHNIAFVLLLVAVGIGIYLL